MKIKKVIQLFFRVAILISLISTSSPKSFQEKKCNEKRKGSPTACAIKAFHVFPGKPLSNTDRKFLPNKLTHHPFYKNK